MARITRILTSSDSAIKAAEVQFSSRRRTFGSIAMFCPLKITSPYKLEEHTVTLENTEKPSERTAASRKHSYLRSKPQPKKNIIITLVSILSFLTPVSTKDKHDKEFAIYSEHYQQNRFLIYHTNNKISWENVKRQGHIRQITDSEIDENPCGPICQCPDWAQSCSF
uniref:Uncharacterized protein n=1 Tax=Heterorhabditis bacteriophora TaxID=37862 RepID=A0A1I7XQH1_HETBA